MLCFQEVKHVDGKKEEFGVLFVLKFSWLNQHLKDLLLPKSESVCNRYVIPSSHWDRTLRLIYVGWMGAS